MQEGHSEGISSQDDQQQAQEQEQGQSQINHQNQSQNDQDEQNNFEGLIQDQGEPQIQGEQQTQNLSNDQRIKVHLPQLRFVNENADFEELIQNPIESLTKGRRPSVRLRPYWEKVTRSTSNKRKAEMSQIKEKLKNMKFSL